MKRRSSLCLAASLLCLTVAASACSNPRESAGSDAGGGTIRIGLASAAYGPYLPVYVAEQEGYFEDRGLDVEITAYQGGGAATEALVAGEADIISYTPAGVAVSRSRGIEQRIIGAGLPTSTGWSVQVRADSDIDSVEDLAGRQVGIGNPGGTGEYFALWAAQSAGIEFETVALGYGALNESLLQGTVDAIVQLPPGSYQLPLSGEARVIMDLGEEMDPTLPDAWVTSDEFIADDPETVQLALEAIYEGVRKLQSDEAYALQILEERAGITGDLAREEYTRTIMALSSDGDIEASWIDNALQLASDVGLDAQGDLPAAKDIYTDEFVPVDASSGE
jgi:NitT/TauT family transport system substrate-binding protein